MASRRQGTSEAAYDDRRERDYSSRNGSRYDDRYEDIEIRRSRNPPVQEREVIREPAYLREDYGRTSAGPVVLRAREREDFEFSSRPRRRSPSPERKVERESIVIRRDEPERPAPKRERSREREEIIIRRDERSRSRAPPPPQDREREEIIIKRSEDDRKSRYEVDDTKSRRVYRPPPVETYERDEIIIRREEEERRPAPRDIDFAVIRPKSRERERSRGRRYSDASDDEIVITRENRSGRRGERDEIIIRHHSASRSPSPSPAPSIAPSVRPEPPLAPQIVNAPEIHQEIITHHRHIDHGYEVIVPPRPRPISRPPSPPSPPPPPPPRERSEERIEIRRRGERNGRAYDEDIIIDRNEGARSAPPRDFYESPPPPRRAPIAQQLMVRPPSPEPEPRAELSGRYGRARDPTAGLWTEVTKDLVVKEAIIQMGYEFEESEDYYYIIAYLKYEDVSRLVGLSEDIRKDRRRRMKEMEWENRLLPLEDEPRPRLAIDSRPPPRRESPWEREDERYIEREIIYRGGRPPPPPVAWRR